MIRFFASKETTTNRRGKSSRQARRRLSIESLEERRMLSILVSSGNCEGPGTLRQAISDANIRYAGRQDDIIIQSNVTEIKIEKNLPSITEGVTISYAGSGYVVLTQAAEPSSTDPLTGGLDIDIGPNVSNAYVGLQGLAIGGFTYLGVGTGISGSNESGTIEIAGCYIFGNSNKGIHLHNSDRVKIHGCIIGSNQEGIAGNGGDGIVFEDIDWPDPNDPNLHEDDSLRNHGDIYLNTITDNGGDGIEFVNCDFASVWCNTVEDNGGNGIMLGGVGYDNPYDDQINDAKLYGNSVTGNGAAGIYVNAEYGGTVDNVEIRPLNGNNPSVIRSNAGPGIYLHANGWSSDTSGNVHYSAMSNVFVGGTAYDTGAGSEVALNQVNHNDGDGIRIRSTGTLVNLSNVYIQGNAIEENGKDGVHVESTLDGTVSNLHVSPLFALDHYHLNRIKSNGRINEGAGDGIEIESGTVSNFSNVTIQSNTLISNKGYGVRINGADSTTVQGNYIGYKPADGTLSGNIRGNRSRRFPKKELPQRTQRTQRRKKKGKCFRRLWPIDATAP